MSFNRELGEDHLLDEYDTLEGVMDRKSTHPDTRIKCGWCNITIIDENEVDYIDGKFYHPSSCAKAYKEELARRKEHSRRY
tara:strand:- start:1107 stop:1349 length:243 start_codon:yes stop_codon:yes gene_type:complete